MKTPLLRHALCSAKESRLRISRCSPSSFLGHQCRQVSVNSGIARGLRAEDVPNANRGWRGKHQPSRRTDWEDDWQAEPRSSRAGHSGHSTVPVPRATFSHEPPLRIKYTTAASQFLAGGRAVTAALKAGRRTAYKLYAAGESQTVQEVRQLASQRNVATENVSEQAIASHLAKSSGMARTPHEGVMLECSPIPELLTRCLGSFASHQDSLELQLQQEHDGRGGADRIASQGQGWRCPVVLWAHEVTDTGNLGALCRTALYFGIAAVAITVRGSSAVTPATIRAGAGAPEFMPLLRIRDPVTFIRESQDRGWQFFSAVAPRAGTKATDPAELHPNPALAKPCVIVLGNEEFGLPDNLVRLSDKLVSIDSRSKGLADTGVDSLNVSVAGAILAERFTRQMDQDEKTLLTEKSKSRIF